MREWINLSKPQQTVLVSCFGSVDVAGKKREVDNLITVDWHMPASFSPPLYIISIGKTRFSLQLVSQTKVFAVNFMAHKHEKEVLYCGRHSGLNKDKYKETGLTPVECEKIDCRRVKEAAAAIECEVIEEIETGDHIIFVGKILQAHNISSEQRLFHTGADEFTTTIR